MLIDLMRPTNEFMTTVWLAVDLRIRVNEKKENPMKKLFHHSLTVVSLFALLISGSSAVAGESRTEDLSNYLCKDVMRLSGEDRDIALAFVHGYRLGKKDTTQFVTQELSEITDKFFDYCLDHPSEPALTVFMKIAK